MAKIYYRLISLGKMTIDEVPDVWRVSVEELLKGNADN